MKNLNFWLKVLCLLFPILMAPNLSAQSSTRTARAVEIEKNIQTELQQTIRNLAPGRPFSVAVRIEPLRRSNAKSTSTKETLPYYESSGDEVRDEWDDPAKTDFDLLNRVTRISVKAVVPDTLNASLITEIKSALTKSIPYVEGRDAVEIEAKDWPLENGDSKLNSTIMAIGFGTLSLIGIAYFIISNLAAGKLSKAITNIKLSGSETANAPAMNMAPPPPTLTVEDSRLKSAHPLGGDSIQFNDTLKMSSIVMDLIRQIEASKSFPVLADMVLVEKYVQTHPQGVGALFAEFPHHIKSRLFSFTSSNAWLKAFADPGKMDAVSFEIINKMVRVDRVSTDVAWEELLIACWRLAADLGGFLKKINPQDALIILQALPQSLSIQVARELLPGEWAVILKKPSPTPLAPTKIAAHLKAATEYRPLRSIQILDQYRKDTELMAYLRQADPQIEKEVYGALPQDSSLFALRPPFFRVLELSADEMKAFVPQVSLEDWALASMNIPKSLRNHIDACFQDRQRLRFTELLKAYDRQSLSAERIGQARERIAQLYASAVKSQPEKSHLHRAREIAEAA